MEKARRDVGPFVEPRGTDDKKFPWERIESKVLMKTTCKPCPKCDRPGRRPEGRVCDKCVDQIMAQHVTTAELRAALDADRVQVNVDHMPHFTDQYEQYRVNSLADALQSLVRSVSTPIDKIDWEHCEPLIQGEQSDRHNRDVVEVPRPFLTAFREVFDQLLKFSERRYNNGRRRGSNLLVGLATGEVSVSDYNEFTIYPKG